MKHYFYISILSLCIGFSRMLCAVENLKKEEIETIYKNAFFNGLRTKGFNPNNNKNNIKNQLCINPENFPVSYKRIGFFSLFYKEFKKAYSDIRGDSFVRKLVQAGVHAYNAVRKKHDKKENPQEIVKL